MKSVIVLGCPAAECAATEGLLAAGDVSVVWADTVARALAELNRREMPVLLDFSRDALAAQQARDLRAARPATLVFAVIDTRRPDLTTEAVLIGTAEVFARPAQGRDVARTIDRERSYVSGVTVEPDASAGAMAYEYSAAMRNASVQIARAATVRAGVMIRGEEGTGRRLAASMVHRAQPAPAGTFVGVDCSQFDGEQLDAELFGAAPHCGMERVSLGSRLFEARNGTLYLSNVVEAPARVQSRLARVLRDREATLAESGETVVLDVRPMVGVDPAFDSAVRDGRVREELFRRISAVRIDMPPLRKRREDIPALANYFLRDICASLRVPPRTLSRPALSLIKALPWRRNAVELRALLAAIVAGLPGARGIALEDVLAHVRLDGGAVVPVNGGTLRQARASFEREYITSVLEHHHGRISEAASVLGIQRTNLYRKMRSLQVSRDRGQ